jgi:hypothetical protein
MAKIARVKKSFIYMPTRNATGNLGLYSLIQRTDPQVRFKTATLRSLDFYAATVTAEPQR